MPFEDRRSSNESSKRLAMEFITEAAEKLAKAPTFPEQKQLNEIMGALEVAVRLIDTMSPATD